MSGRNFAGNGNATITKSSAIDSTADGSYTLVGNAACTPPLVPVTVVSAKTHGTAGVFNLDLPVTGNPGIECRTGGPNGNHTLVFNFANPLNSVAGASVTGTESVSSSAIGTDRHQYIVNLTGVANAQKITVTLSGGSGTAGNSAATLPVVMGVLLGDTTANGAVNSSDVSQTQAQSGQTVSTDNFREDVTANGAINSSDIGTVQANSGTALP